MNKENIGYAWNLVADLGNGKQFSISGNFHTDATAEHMGAEVDKVNAVVNRQQAKAAMIAVAQEVDQRIAQRDAAKGDLSDIDAKHEAKGGLSAAERQQREAAAKHIEKLNADIEYKKGVLAKLQDEAK